MPSAFVPFLKSDGKSSAPAPRGAASPSADSAAMSGAFAALVPNANPASACVHAATESSLKPVVTLKKDGDRVTHIHIQCACGQVVELECAY